MSLVSDVHRGEQFQAVMFDGDGTAFEHGATEPSAELCEIIARSKIGTHLITGRARRDCAQLIQNLGVTSAVISGGGRILRRNRDGAYISSMYDVLPIASFDVPHIHLFLDEIAGNIDGAQVEIPDWQLFGPDWLPTPGDWIGQHVDSIFLRNLPNRAVATAIALSVEAEFIDDFGRPKLSAFAVTAQNPDLADVQINSRNGTKRNGVERLAARHGYDLGRVAIVGDDLNDIPMLKVAGHAVAVENAHPEVKAMADQIIASPPGGLIEFLAGLSA